MLLPLLLNLGFAGGTAAQPQPPQPTIVEQTGDGVRKSKYNYEVDEQGELQERLKEEEDILLFIKVFLKWV